MLGDLQKSLQFNLDDLVWQAKQIVLSSIAKVSQRTFFLIVDLPGTLASPLVLPTFKIFFAYLSIFHLLGDNKNVVTCCDLNVVRKFKRGSVFQSAKR